MSIVEDLLLAGRDLRMVEPGIGSVLPPNTHSHRYDGIAPFYDRLVGRRLYNRVIWANRPEDYRDFVRAALDAAPKGPHLDAGCGSLLFTAGVYRQAGRPVVGLDRSLGMLRRARARLAHGAGEVPEGVALVQGDLFDLPFRHGSFASIVALGLLHLFDEPGRVIAGLDALLAPNGRLSFTSLVRSGRPLGDAFLRQLSLAGQAAAARSGEEVRAIVAAQTVRPVDFAVRGNMAYVTVGD